MQRFIVALIGVIFLGLGVFMYVNNKNLVKNCTVETEATVVDMKQEFADSDSTSTYMYSPIIEYTANDQLQRVTMDKSSSTPAYDINEKITILYNPNNVKQYIVKGEKSSSIFSIVFMAIGLLVTGYGVVVAFKKN